MSSLCLCSCDHLVLYVFLAALKRHKLTGDTSVMTYRGHGVLHTLVRCRFSPEFTTGQRFIYSGCSTGKIISESHHVIICVSAMCRTGIMCLHYGIGPMLWIAF